jgi:TetR/AcrR family transcriptional regulator of autoinduction and epiphytic fitness
VTSTREDHRLSRQSQDGRLVRSARTRDAIVDAMRSLHHEGDLRPTASRVAEKAGVSLRTVWQHFADLETLLLAAGQRDFEVASSYVVAIDAGQPLAARVDQLVDQRSQLFEAVAPVWRAGRLQEPFSPQIQRNRDRIVDAGREQLARVFAPELAAVSAASRRTTMNALQAATNWATWESLRTDLRLSTTETQQVVSTLVLKLLDTP